MFQDFCYYANTIFLVYLLFYPKNEKLFLVCFSFAEVSMLSLIIWWLGRRMIYLSTLWLIQRAFAGAISMGFDCLALQLSFQFSWQNCQCSYPSFTWYDIPLFFQQSSLFFYKIIKFWKTLLFYDHYRLMLSIVKYWEYLTK